MPLAAKKDRVAALSNSWPLSV
uniref:Uncharacterized protein n=1 Tax=Arundo donax TaxID=35708 RepID=A0A0A9C077_ARUDO